MRVGYNTQSDTLWSAPAGYTGKKSITIALPGGHRPTSDNLILWLLIHELGHRLLDQHNIRSTPTQNEEQWHEQEHKLLFSFLLEAMYYAFGKDRSTTIMQEHIQIGDTSIPAKDTLERGNGQPV